MVPAASSDQSDVSIAVAAAQAAVRAAERARDAPLRPRAKGVPADLVTDADQAAEHAAVAILREHRPRDAIVGEEGTQTGGGRRGWGGDGIDGTVSFANRIPGGWCAAVALEDEHGPKAAAVQDPLGELYAAARGEGATCDGQPIRLRAPRPLEEAHVALFLRQDRLVQPGVRASGHALVDRVGLFRHSGPGSLELAWVAA